MMGMEVDGMLMLLWMEVSEVYMEVLEGVEVCGMMLRMERLEWWWLTSRCVVAYVLCWC